MGLLSVIKNLFGINRRIPLVEFQKCVFNFVNRKISNRSGIETVIAEYGRLLESPTVNDDLERDGAELYLKIEKYISEEQSSGRIAGEKLREMILKSCGAERAEGNMALIFLPASLRRIRLYERYTQETVLKSSSLLTGENQKEILDFIVAQENFSGVYKDSLFDWVVLESRIGKMPDEKREEWMRSALGKILNKIFQVLSGSFETIRAEMTFKEIYRTLSGRLRFIEDFPQVLLIIPKGLLQEERVSIKGKSELTEEVRQRTQELESALGQLSEEKKKLSAALEELRIVDRAKSDFITVVSHQFRTPLSAIRWNNELMSEELEKIGPEKLRDKLAEYIKVIHEKSVILINTLEDIYDVLAIEGKTSMIEKKPSQLWEIVDDAIKAMSREAIVKSVELFFDRATAPLKEIKLDARKIQRVLTILLRNAIQYTPEKGKVSVRITEIELLGKPALACEVKDTGVGISAEDMKKLFAKFFRAKNAVEIEPDGAGLGLYLVKNFIEAHGGSVKVNSELGKGSSFTFIIPSN